MIKIVRFIWVVGIEKVKIDWTLKESIQAELRLRVKKILKKYGYPPSGQEHATELVLTQAKKIAEDWANIEIN